MKKCVACAEEIQDEAKLCRHCKTVQSDKRFATGAAAPKSESRSEFGPIDYGSSQFDRDKLAIQEVWNRFKVERPLQIAVVYTLLTVLDSLFWLTWRDPFSSFTPGAAELLGFRNFYEWFLPTLASVFLFLAWWKADKRFFVWAVWAGGFTTIGLDLLVNLPLRSFLGLFEFGDLVDLAGAIGLVVVFFLQRSRQSNEDWFTPKGQ